MPQKVIKFTGINRKVNEFQGSGACEELINLRPGIGGGTHVIKPKKIEEGNVDYEQFYIHSFGDTRNRIAVTIDGRVLWVNGNKTITSDFVGLPLEPAGEAIEISSAGNVLVIYSRIYKEQRVFKFENGEYVGFNIIATPIEDAEIVYNYNSSAPASYEVDFDTNQAATLTRAVGGFYSEFPDGLCGAAVVGCTYELEDGMEIWSTAFVVANVERCNGYKKPERLLSDSGTKTKIYGASKVELELTLNTGDYSGVRRINVYSTRPIFQYEGVAQTVENASGIKRLTLDEANLDGELMYYQGSISLDKPNAKIALNFTKTLTGEKVMEVTSGVIQRVGHSFSYNNRFHYYGSDLMHTIQMPTVSDAGHDKDGTSFWVAYVKFDDKWKAVENLYQFSASLPNDFIYPMAKTKQMAFLRAETLSNGSVSVPYTDMFYVDLKDSSAYNYAFAFDVTPSLQSAAEFKNILTEQGQLWGTFDQSVLLRKETNAINVSAPYNPFAFPVEYSYSFGGEILDASTSYLPISATQVGQYPISVFTTNGIYALEQGDGSVLYSNVTPLQPLVINGKATSTPFGTFFTSSKSLYLLSGRESANVSYVLNGERELTLRDTEAYRKLVCNKTGVIYDFSPFVSSEDFESFVDNVALVYDQLNNEIYISKADGSVPYSYVLNLDTRAYHKIAKRYLSTQNGSRYVIEVEGSTRNVVDLHTEESSEQHILLQSRPMPLEMAFTHIQRLLLLIDAKLTGKAQNLCFTVFASDNLYDWNCIITSQKRSTILRQISTNRAAKSYRDYVILITGTVDTDTDISDIIADYTIVNRRLG